MADRPPGNFGRSLREARERRGISLRQIANATKIGMSALEALERNDISRLPGGIFSRAFVRSYALEVGLDPEATLQEFIAQFRTIRSRPPIPPTLGEDHQATKASPVGDDLRAARALSVHRGRMLYFDWGRRAACGQDQACRARAAPVEKSHPSGR